MAIRTEVQSLRCGFFFYGLFCCYSDSDIDVLVLLEGEKRDLSRESAMSGALYDVELASGVLISPMIMLRSQWENRPFKTPFYINVMNEGVKI